MALFPQVFVKNQDGSLRELFRRFEIAVLPERVWCDLCKSRIHCTARCPYPLVKGWNGITSKDLGVRAESLTPLKYAGPAGASPPATFSRSSTAVMRSMASPTYAEAAAAPTAGMVPDESLEALGVAACEAAPDASSVAPSTSKPSLPLIVSTSHLGLPPLDPCLIRVVTVPYPFG
ncbi:hypothetical protein GY45DRAFT_1376009 [Cubamyces sp. BRFM 1775]|nr:hypothetical protein GY45DRAFT_1376009 [Cubamyces sp. BRFM 1775]